MILQLIGIGACLKGIQLCQREKHKEEIFIRNTWKECLADLTNKDGKGFNIIKIEESEFGFILSITIPNGYSFHDLESKKEIVESNFKCRVKFEHLLNLGLIKARLYTKPIIPGDFKLLSTNNHSIYVGSSYEGHKIIDMYTYPQVVIAGINNSGKSYCLYTILTTLYQHKDIECYIAQPAKNDLYFFRNALQTKVYAQSMEESLNMFQEVYNRLTDRAEQIKNVMHKGINDVKSYNAKMSDKINPIWVVSDEFSLYMPDATDSKIDKLVKEQCLDYLKKIIKLGRAYAIYIIVSLQKTTADQMPNFLKTQANTKLCFRQTDRIASQNIINSSEAYMLPQGEFILQTDDTYHCKTPFIKEEDIQKYVKLEKPKAEAIFVERKSEEFGVIRGGKNDHGKGSKNDKSR